MFEIKRKFINAGDVNLFCLDSGTEGLPIICLHGRWGRAETWVDFIRNYSVRFRVIAPDQRGHGLSDKPVSTYSIEEMSDDIEKMVAELEIDKFIIVGHSMGGAIAARIAARNENVIGLAILDKSPAGPGKAIKQPDEIELCDPVTFNWPLPFSSLSEASEFIKKEMQSELSYQYFMNSLVETPAGYSMMYSIQAISANIANYHNWYDVLGEIGCPTMIARSSSHEAVNDDDFERMRRDIKNSFICEISHPDHNVHLSKKEEFYNYFDRFISKIVI
ncbi:alpha/beta fold hydrolase [Paludibacterium purpuratum]|uniref:2-succinyl-6-hydroxy-2, 4-cyclohexadiene-1-carboxylate synthase n=1 Tax=Paludibacterium purpuratum TaxID=1144873 RepID=A0A4R7AUN4_9NEIS|nr:alpha/beta hydrolase [Paludibacterium purpuratum]TDR70639.1 2-succinyl-6-hydroxy-2,4-cyclohexadiene-1-carboxylate synthase [Paludibacterium purpuratum]